MTPMTERPNIVCILSDDQGAWAMGCAGNDEIRTPHIDALAASGLRFSNFFCASPVCSPARASLLTGVIPSAHGVLDWLRGGNVDRAAVAHIEDPDVRGRFASEHAAIAYLDGMTTYTDLLAGIGYTCALSGKWHLGDSLTPQHGFAHWYTIARGDSAYFRSDTVRDGAIGVEGEYITDLITQDACANIDRLAPRDAPFYLSVHYTAPHSPWDEGNHPAELIDLYRDCAFASVPDLPMHPWQIASAPRGTGERRKELLRGYYAAVTGMDRGIGAIVERLRDRGVLDNTLILFLSDNGMNMGHHGIWGKGNGTFPQNMYDTSVRVPFIASWPGHIEAGVVDGLYGQCDVLPTLRDYLGLAGDVAQEALLAGRSFAGRLRGEADGEGGAIYIADEYGPVRMVRTRDWKYVHRYPYGPHELYDLRDDPDEARNLYGDARHADRIEALRRDMERFFHEHSAPGIDGRVEPVNGMGQLRRPGVYADGKPAFAQERDFLRER